jgi:hypothetical protein
MKIKISNKRTVTIIVIIAAVATSIITSKNGGDFDVFLDAGLKLSNMLNIYTPPFFNGLQYYYSPFFAWILIPFSKQFFVTEIAWTLLSYFLLYRSFLIAKTYFNSALLSPKKYKYWIITLILFSFQFVSYNIALIQVTIFILWAILESLNLFFNGKNFLGGVILGVSINIKIMPIIILPYLFYRAKFKACLYTVLTFTSLLFIPSFTLGWDFNQFLLSEWWKIINPNNKEHLFETGIGTHSLVALLPVYLTPTSGEMEFRRHLFNLSNETIEVVILIARISILALSVFFLRSLPFKNEENKLNRFYEISYFCLIIPLIMPHQQKYAFLLSMPMIAYLNYFFLATYRKEKPTIIRISLVIFIACMFFYSPLYGSDIIGRFLFLCTQHYRILTWATILLIPIAIICSPRKLNDFSQNANCV